MDETTRIYTKNIYSQDRALQNEAYYALMEATSVPIDWIYEVWDELLTGLRHKDNHVRAIAAQLLSNLAISDLENRMSRDFEALLAVTKDERFVTARHAMQSLWKVGLAGEAQRKMVVAGLARRFEESVTEKNATLIRYDIIEDLRKLYDATSDETIRTIALRLIDTETDVKYRKKYAGVWK